MLAPLLTSLYFSFINSSDKKDKSIFSPYKPNIFEKEQIQFLFFTTTSSNQFKNMYGMKNPLRFICFHMCL